MQRVFESAVRFGADGLADLGQHCGFCRSISQRLAECAAICRFLRPASLVRCQVRSCCGRGCSPCWFFGDDGTLDPRCDLSLRAARVTQKKGPARCGPLQYGNRSSSTGLPLRNASRAPPGGCCTAVPSPWQRARSSQARTGFDPSCACLRRHRRLSRCPAGGSSPRG